MLTIKAVIKKTPNKEEWGVYSHTGKSLGKYPSHAQAEARLAQVEMFKHMKKKSAYDKDYRVVISLDDKEFVRVFSAASKEHAITQAGVSILRTDGKATLYKKTYAWPEDKELFLEKLLASPRVRVSEEDTTPTTSEPTLPEKPIDPRQQKRDEEKRKHIEDQKRRLKDQQRQLPIDWTKESSLTEAELGVQSAEDISWMEPYFLFKKWKSKTDRKTTYDFAGFEGNNIKLRPEGVADTDASQDVRVPLADMYTKYDLIPSWGDTSRFPLQNLTPGAMLIEKKTNNRFKVVRVRGDSVIVIDQQTGAETTKKEKDLHDKYYVDSGTLGKEVTLPAPEEGKTKYVDRELGTHLTYNGVDPEGKLNFLNEKGTYMYKYDNWEKANKKLKRVDWKKTKVSSLNEEIKTPKNVNVEDLLEKLYTDPLTSLRNRHFFEDNREDLATTVKWYILIDIDHFKDINDELGHAEGDEVLKQIAAVIKSTASNGIVMRWGGEEFVVLIAEADQDKVEELAESLRAAVEQIELPVKNVDDMPNVTISLGVSPFTGNFEESFKQADSALYVSKEGGRNQVTMYKEGLDERAHKIDADGALLKDTYEEPLDKYRAVSNDGFYGSAYGSLNPKLQKVIASIDKAGLKVTGGIKETLRLVIDLVAPFAWVFMKNAKLRGAFALIQQYLNEGVMVKASLIPNENAYIIEHKLGILCGSKQIEDLELSEIFSICAALKEELE